MYEGLENLYKVASLYNKLSYKFQLNLTNFRSVNMSLKFLGPSFTHIMEISYSISRALWAPHV